MSGFKYSLFFSLKVVVHEILISGLSFKVKVMIKYRERQRILSWTVYFSKIWTCKLL